MALELTKIGVIRNRRSHANRDQVPTPPEGVLWGEPETPEALADDLRRFAEANVALVVVDGGDGTVREVLSALPGAFGADAPILAVLPSGKTNVLALDLGVQPRWTLDAALAQVTRGPLILKTRRPLALRWSAGSQPPVQGFIFGLGAFVRATQMSHAVHRMGAFHSLAVALTVVGAAFGALFGRDSDGWRQGVSARLAIDGEEATTAARFVVLATALKRLPLGLRPFGPPQEGLKVLEVSAPPKRLALALPAVLLGGAEAWLRRHGYRRALAEGLIISSPESVVIDGDVFPGGEITISLAPPLRFLVP
ncbi:diacylglycerol kinase family protein [Phenylobacterium sp.]|uniref:diacylglycerol/lipid kinase family protein n=1 Tax=Phenylobacterium sp. TaxID=1871053 RepID=UPI002731054C|nr:diacylglycerol kinase family protein [Phenylobacterium sp.]MDP1618444.1 diacylglycerol kinase family protein [Phenylobacterium sp.]MDP1988063.1 diacylglycerol kinase family protein [Phenylobacterium sp.]